MVKTEYEIITGEMTALRDDAQSKQLQRFFKTGEGEYGHGDKFLGIKVPATRSVAKRHKTADNDTLRRLMQSEWHEIRLCALLIMVEKMKKADDGARHELTDMYLSVTDRINNWDLVDLSAPHIVGNYLLDKPRDLLYTLAGSPLLWDNRIAMVATYAFIKQGDLDDTYALALRFISHPHELMHGLDAARGRQARHGQTESLRHGASCTDAAHHAALCHREVSRRRAQDDTQNEVSLNPQ